jgi:very-short-patch-repair endonuclease
MSFICKYCNKSCKNKNSLAQHEIRCKNNPNKINTTINNFNKTGRTAWNKGLSKTDPRVAKQAITLSKNTKGKTNHPQTLETRLKISKARKNFLEQNPDKVPFKLNHSSKESYPEKYFRVWLNKIALLEEQELQVSRYTLDFAWKAAKIYLEIDGSQHKLDWMQQHDEIRTKFLEDLGWTCVWRVDWAEYQKLTKYQKHKYLVKLKNKLLAHLGKNVVL